MKVQPRATYRVQLRHEFDFAAATSIVPYLAELGISHMYCSPYMQAAPGSAHGYDVVDPTRISTELGGDGALRDLAACLIAHDMSQMLDIVPNHMCVTSPSNPFWWDVLHHGRDSGYAAMFDIEWDAPAAPGRIVLPVLGAELDTVIENGELQVKRVDSVLELHYYEQRFPLRDDTSTPAEGAATRKLLDGQHYSLEFWRTGLRRVNYRRFFDVSSLAGVRVELEEVLRLTHRRTLQLVGDEVVDGVRVDHIDGLLEPQRYASALRAAAPNSWIVVEKILAEGERLPDSWPVDGTTGYDFAALLVSLMVEPKGLRRVGDIYREFTHDRETFEEHCHAAKVLVLEQLLSSELERLDRVAEKAGVSGAAAALRELIAGMPVYRLYPDGWTPLHDADRVALDVAAARARGHLDVREQQVLGQLLSLLQAEGEPCPARVELRRRFQQVSSAAIAKGVEDTVFYRYVPLVALNEVGCDPTRTTPVTAFHAYCRDAAERTPLTMLATATHDTKRGEDARLRVAMLAEMPQQWATTVQDLREQAQQYRGTRGPSAAAEYLLYQTLVAAHPASADRIWEYMQKAAREAKQETSWLDPDIGYEAELEHFVRSVAADSSIQQTVAALLGEMSPAWQTAALSQALLKLTAPGIPDIYQGCELWDLHLVDPDNRTPVDYDERRSLLARLKEMTAADAARHAAEPLGKLHAIRTALDLRRRKPEIFSSGSSYAQLEVRGERSAHAIAFGRGRETASAVAVVGVRLAYGLGGDWRDTEIDLPGGNFRNLLDGSDIEGGKYSLSSLLERFPVALLERVA